jgi:hypothetical protein
VNGRFEGLSLPQLAELLHGLAEPPAVSMLPATAGWRIVALWALAVAFVAFGHGVLRWRRNRYRREAEAALDRIARQLPSDPDAIAAVGVVLKRTAMTAYARNEVASLHGSAWADFLCRRAPGDPVVAASATQLAVVSYQPVEDSAAIMEAARRWVRHHDA